MFNITYSQVFYVNKSSHGVQHKYSLVFCVNKSSHSVQHMLCIMFYNNLIFSTNATEPN